MTPTTAPNWQAANQRYLLTALEHIWHIVHGYVKRRQGQAEETATSEPVPPALAQLARAMPRPPSLETFCVKFNLTPFERDLLLLCAGMELSTRFATLFAAAHGDPQRAYPTLSLALAALPNSNWGALTPAAALRRWRMIEIGAGSALTLSPLRIDERVLHYLAGCTHLDERLMALMTPASSFAQTTRHLDELVPSHRTLAEHLITAWSQAPGTALAPVVQLYGDEQISKRTIATAVCTHLCLNLYILAVDTLPTNPNELELLLRLWEREAVLTNSTLLLDCDNLDAADTVRTGLVSRIVARMESPLIISARERWRTLQRPLVAFDVGKPNTGEQRRLWQGVLGAAAPGLNGQIDTLVMQFNLSPHAIQSAGAEALMQQTHSPASLNRLLWEACRTQARPRLEDLAQRIDPAAAWDDLVLPAGQRQILRDVAAHVRQRARVYETWGFAGKGARGLGISALFAGASGTGKTMAAEVLAGELHLDLYRIDLSAVVSKYIGETEKNLRRIFDVAEEGGAILLFDEADALFGKRSEVKDSHDRYANIEVSYLLQRMEAYRGLAILTTNLKSALDTAFLRRIRFIVQFPFPDVAQRAAIWRRIFPSDTPTRGLDPERLARLNVAGGNIRNIALNAAFLAADADEPVQMEHLLRATRSEYAKLEKSLTEAEISGWV